jgi:predicted PurR-regulated permease PerM
MMNKENFFALLMLAIIGVSFYFFYRVFSPYAVPIGWAVVLTLVFYPAYERFNRWLRNRRSLASLVVTILTILIIVLPGVLLLFLLGKEVVQIYKIFEAGVSTEKFQFLLRWREIPWIHELLSHLDPWLNLSQINLQNMILQTLREFSTFVLNQSTKFVLGFSQFVFGFLLMAVSMFYLFRDGEGLLEKIKGLIPLTSGEKELLFSRIHEMVHATIFGGVLVAMIQGFLGGLGFWILGLPSPVLWGFVMTLLAICSSGGSLPCVASSSRHSGHAWTALRKGHCPFDLGSRCSGFVRQFLKTDTHQWTHKTEHPGPFLCRPGWTESFWAAGVGDWPSRGDGLLGHTGYLFFQIGGRKKSIVPVREWPKMNG